MTVKIFHDEAFSFHSSLKQFVSLRDHFNVRIELTIVVMEKNVPTKWKERVDVLANDENWRNGTLDGSHPDDSREANTATNYHHT